MIENKKDMYIVIKKEDMRKYLTTKEIYTLDIMLCKIHNGRLDDNKHPINTYHVCNTDESYADAVHKVIIGGEALKILNKENTPSRLDACGSNCLGDC